MAVSYNSVIVDGFDVDGEYVKKESDGRQTVINIDAVKARNNDEDPAAETGLISGLKNQKGESFDLIFFPTQSPKNNDCAWLSYEHIFKPDQFKDKTILELKNGKKIVVDVSTSVIHNQLYRCSRLKETLAYRKIDKNSHN